MHILKDSKLFTLLKSVNATALVNKALSGGALDLADSTRLVHLWQEHCIKACEAKGFAKWKISYNDLHQWAEDIALCFPTETVGTWFKHPPHSSVTQKVTISSCSFSPIT